MFKNWKAICLVADKYFMQALALLDLTTSFGQTIVERLPEFFTDEQQIGPIPLSVIKMRARQITQRLFGEEFDEYPVTYGVLREYHIPVIEFWDQSDNPTPPEIKFFTKKASQGDSIEWQGKKMVLLEKNSDCGSGRYFALAEFIAVDK